MNSLINHPLIKGYMNSNNFGKLLGMNVEIISPGEIQYLMSVSKEHLATPNAAHGGSISALMDASMGVCALSYVMDDYRVVSTIEMKISFISPSFIGDKLVATASIIKSSKRLLFVEGEILNQDGKLISLATGTFNSYPAQKAGFIDCI